MTSATVEVLGKGYNTISLVEEARRFRDVSKNEFSEVWCVFDKDDFSETDFDNAIVLAESFGFKVACSNQAFEYWLVLHFNDHQGGAINRRNYVKMINSGIKPFNLQYAKNGKKIVTDEIFEILLAKDSKYHHRRRIDLAIQRAKRIMTEFKNNNIPYSSRCSSTSVHKLVIELLKYTD